MDAMTTLGKSMQVPFTWKGCNYYTLNSKSYYNFSIILPVNEEFLDHAALDLRVNGLMNIVILQTTEEKISDLRAFIQDTLGMKLDSSL